MSFQICEPGKFQAGTGLAEGQCSIARNATLVLRRDDMQLVSADLPRVVLLIDPETRRLAIRAPDDGEETKTVTASELTRKGRPVARRRILIARGLKRLGLKAEEVAGRYELLAKDNLLLVSLGAPGVRADGKAAKKRK